MKNNLAEFSLENLEVVTIMLKQTLETEDFTNKQLKIFKLLNEEVWKTYSEIKEKLQGYSNQELPEIMKSLTESQPNLFLTKLEKKKGISEEDAIEYIKGKENMFDIVLIDSTDPMGPGEGLFTEEFYTNVKKLYSLNAFHYHYYVVKEEPIAYHYQYNNISPTTFAL